MEIDGTIVMVTGGASGIGAAMVRAFDTAGAAHIVVADIDLSRAEGVAVEVSGTAIRLDVSDEEATAAAIAAIEAEHGRLDILCCNAGIATDGSVDAPTDAWQRTWDINVMAHVYAMRHALPGMLARGSGHIVSTASAAGLLTNLGAAPYAVTKHAAVALAEWVSITYGDRGIGVSCVCPQFVDTPMLGAFEGHSDAMQRWVRSLAIDADAVAAEVIDAVAENRFLVLPHAEVADYVTIRATDHERWLAGMRRLQADLGG